MQNAARLSDAINHGGSVTSGSGDVFINNISAARVGDSVNCSQHGGGSIAAGSGSVTINGAPAARLGDPAGCGATISSGSGDVLIG